MQYRSCGNLENFVLAIRGHVEHGPLTFCCVSGEYPPKASFLETPEATINNFMRIRAEIVAENVKFGLLKSCVAEDKQEYTFGCHKCSFFKEKDWEPGGNGLINHVILACYPSPCQSKCVYCYKWDDDIVKFDAALHEAPYEKVFQFLEYIQEKNYVASDAMWDVSSGEITIHPYKDRIYELVRGKQVAFFTNCFLYDEQIGNHLSESPASYIHFSIDAGTPNTWHKIKGVNNFETVTDNLVKYYARCSRNGQITLKYIILPGINDNLADYKSVIEIMKILKTNKLSISRDTSAVHTTDCEVLLGAAGCLVAMLYKNDLEAGFWGYSSSEISEITEFAVALIKEEISF